MGKGLRKARPHFHGEAAAAAAARADLSAWVEVRRRTRLSIIARAQHLEEQLFSLGQTHRFNRPALKRSEKSGTIQRWKGAASFLSPNAITLSPSNEGEGEIIEAENFLIATGSVPQGHFRFENDGHFILTPQELVKACPSFPQTVVILGAGMEGCETATVLAAMGTPHVHLISDCRALLPREDDDVSDFARSALRSDGIQMHMEASLEYVKVHADRGAVECRIVETHWITARDRRGTSGGAELVRNRVPTTVWADRLVLCNGRVPNTQGLQLDRAGVYVDEHGGVLVDYLNRSVSANHICAAGDVCGGGRAGGLTAIAEMQARWGVEKLFDPDGPFVRPVYRGVGSVLQVTPEMAFVGMSEAEAQRRGIPHVAAKVMMRDYALGVIRKYGAVGSENDAWLRLRDNDSAPVAREEDQLACGEVPGEGVNMQEGESGSKADREAVYTQQATSEDERLAGEEAQRAEEDTNNALGFVKIVVRDDGSWSLLGLRAAGEGCRSAIQAAAMLIGTRQHIQTLAAAPHPHPSVSEAVQECVRVALGCSLHKSHLTPESGSYVRVFRPEAHDDVSPQDVQSVSSTRQPVPLSSVEKPNATSAGSEEQEIMHKGKTNDEGRAERKHCLVPNYLT